MNMFQYEDNYPPQASRWAFVGMFIAVFIWGVTFVIVKDTVSIFPIFPFLAIRFSIATFALLPFLIIERRKYAKNSLLNTITKRRGFYAGLALFCAYALQTSGLKLTSVSSAAFLTSLYLVFIPIFLFLTRRANSTWHEWLASILALGGVYILTHAEEPEIGLGNILIILCAACYAIQILLVSTKNHKQLPILFTTIQMAVVAIASTGIAILQAPREPLSPLPLSVLEAALFTGLIATSFCYLVQTWSQQHLSATQASVMLSLEPVFATLAGSLVIKEILSQNLLIGGGLILASVLISQLTSLDSNII
jgi:drug/metabolite transporter (DMT)-like permease